MNLKEQNILFFLRATQHGGTENVVLQLCEIFHPLVNKIVVVSSDGFSVEKLAPYGIKHYSIPDIENKSPNSFFTILRIIKNIVEQENITIIHTHHRMAAFYISLLRLYKKCIFINTSHNTFTSKKILTRFSYKHAHLISCGEMVKKNLVEYFKLPDQQITVIHNAVKPFKDKMEPDPVISELHNKGYFVIGNVGRLSEQKGMEYYIKAIPIVIEKCPEVRFLIIGSGEDEEKLKNLSYDLNVDNYLTFMGYRNDIQNIMSQIDLVVLSSLWEGLPLIPIEAFSVGKTIVATAVDGTVEIVENNKNGYLVSPKDSKELAFKVAKLSSQKNIRENFEEEAYITFVSSVCLSIPQST